MKDEINFRVNVQMTQLDLPEEVNRYMRKVILLRAPCRQSTNKRDIMMQVCLK